MKIIFAGTAEFALPALRALLNSPHKICAIYTQPDRPAGRGQKITANPIKKFALAHNLPIYQPTTLKDPIVQKQLQDLAADILINIAYGMILPETVLNSFKFGCANIHPSLLPRWRGAAPIQRAIEAHDQITGVTIMQMDMGLDTGGIYKQETLPIGHTDTTATLFIKTAELGAKLLLETINKIEIGTAKITAQNDAQTTYAKKLTKEEGKIDWHKSAQELDCMIRAFNPWPIAYTEIDGLTIRIWQAEAQNNMSQKITAATPGTIDQSNKNGIDIVTGKEILRLLKIQLPGGKPLPVKDILNAHQQLFAVDKKLVS
ncbi:10-formyltetrahydrofolate:L-methionyl-tRNA(fMet) N-formyltransferase [Gammaproteobacteria bacterium]